MRRRDDYPTHQLKELKLTADAREDLHLEAASSTNAVKPGETPV